MKLGHLIECAFNRIRDVSKKKSNILSKNEKEYLIESRELLKRAMKALKDENRQ